MSKFEYGFVRAVSEIVAGFVMSVVLSSFVLNLTNVDFGKGQEF